MCGIVDDVDNAVAGATSVIDASLANYIASHGIVDQPAEPIGNAAGSIGNAISNGIPSAESAGAQTAQDAGRSVVAAPQNAFQTETSQAETISQEAHSIAQAAETIAQHAETIAQEAEHVANGAAPTGETSVVDVVNALKNSGQPMIAETAIGSHKPSGEGTFLHSAEHTTGHAGGFWDQAAAEVGSGHSAPVHTGLNFDPVDVHLGNGSIDPSGVGAHTVATTWMNDLPHTLDTGTAHVGLTAAHNVEPASASDITHSLPHVHHEFHTPIH